MGDNGTLVGLSTFFDEIENKAKNTIHILLPKKIITLQALHQSFPQFNPQESLLDSSEVPINNHLITILSTVKLELLELIEMLDTIKVWIKLNIPIIEDGNNFGVSIQQEIVGELSRTEIVACALLNTTTVYHVSRGKLISKMLKHPGIEDYRSSIIDLDEKEYIHMRMFLMHLRNNYATINDLLTKNLQKLEQPRNNGNVTSLY